ncbi:MAG: hypothetical protein P8J87_15715, partial [Verrucomicrobiales bacterium]|nr:hypothetical protein [Verrucomicrobiales bacterium]
MSAVLRVYGWSAATTTPSVAYGECSRYAQNSGSRSLNSNVGGRVVALHTFPSDDPTEGNPYWSRN